MIEIDGDVHADPNQIKKDQLKTEYLKGRGLHVIRYTNEEVLKNLEGVLEDLQNWVDRRRSTSP